MNLVELEEEKVGGAPRGESATFLYSQKEDAAWLFAVLSLSQESDGELAQVGKEIFATLSKSFFANLGKGALEALRGCLQLASSSPDRQLDIVSCAFLKNALYLGVLGEGEVQVVREGKVETILPVDISQNLQVSSGFTHLGDLVLLLSDQFVRQVDKDRLESLVKSPRPLAEIADALGPKIHQLEDSSKLGAFFLWVKKVNEEKVSPHLEKEETGGSVDDGVSGVPGREHAVSKEEPSGVEREEGQLGRGLKALLTFPLKVLSLPKRVIFLRSEARPRRRIFLALGAILILALLGSVFYNQRVARERVQNEAFEQSLLVAQNKFTEAKGAFSADPALFRQLLADAQGLAKDAQEKARKKSQKERVRELLAQIDQEEQRQIGQEVAEAPTFFDLTIIKNEAKGDQLSLLGKNILVCDRKTTSLYLVSLDNKKSEILAGGKDLAGLTFCSLSQAAAYALTDKGIYKIDLGSKEKELIVERDEDVKSPKDLGNFISNVYVLDSGVPQIFKYTPTASGFGRLNYVKGDVPQALGKASSMAIDGFIWVLASDGEILKFSQGQFTPFSISGLADKLISPQAIYTNEDIDNLYILDRDGRVVVLDKNGLFKTQVKSASVRDATSFVVDEASRKILLASGSRILELPLP